MITGEIGEHRNVVLDIGNTALIEPVAGDFHRARGGAGAQVITQHALQRDRIRRGVFGWLQCFATINCIAIANDAVADGANDRAFPSRHRGGCRDPLRNRRLAVGAGHAGHPQRLGRMAIDMSGDLTRVNFQVRHPKMRHLPIGVPNKCIRLIQHRRGATGDCIGNKFAAIARRAGIGEKGKTAPRFAAGRGHVVDRRGQARQRVGQLHFGKVRCQYDLARDDAVGCTGAVVISRRRVHQPRSFAFIIGAALASRNCGASGGTPDIRNACDITLEKTGAETSPPKCLPAPGSSIITAMM